MLFKKKYIYKVEYKDTWGDYGCVVVKAIDEASAWKKARRQFFNDSYFKPMSCLGVSRLNEA